tara:strand:- start:234 stop:383 length:150 start_codon:yes stop_codon:yes gene_type:complete
MLITLGLEELVLTVIIGVLYYILLLEIFSVFLSLGTDVFTAVLLYGVIV